MAKKNRNSDEMIVCLGGAIERYLEFLDKVITRNGARLAKEEELAQTDQRISGVTLYSKSHKGSYQYYTRTAASGKEEYLPAGKRELAVFLSQLEYDRKVVHAAQAEKRILSKYLKETKQFNVSSLIYGFSPGKQALIKPVAATDESCLKAWKEMRFVPKAFKPEDPVITNASHQRVRSKSEVIISDALASAGIPYHYEKPLELGRRVVYPDFTVLNLRERKVYYWEHLGMMDIPEYAAKAVKKISGYASEGYYPGHRLILSFETNEYPLCADTVQELIKEYLL